MTIAACYLSPEGVVFGADSASTYNISPLPFMPPKEKHYNFGQKIFELGNDGSLGVVTWGIGGLPSVSYRTLLAELADDLEVNPAKSVLEVAERWSAYFWPRYSAGWKQTIDQLKILSNKLPFDALKQNDPAHRTIQEEMFFNKEKQGLVVGFCLGGCVKGDRNPHAFELIFDPLLDDKPAPGHLPQAQSFWGVPALISRLINGCADEVVNAIVQSGKWNGTKDELLALISRHKLVHPSTVPIREAIDFTHACLLTTIKAMKFSNLPLLCGGPIELAVVTTDRQFRWVRHKSWESAIRDGETNAA